MKRKSMSFASGTGSASSNVERVDVYCSEDQDDVGFTEGEPKVKNAVATFNFAMGSEKAGSVSTPDTNELNKPSHEAVESKKPLPGAVEAKKPAFEFTAESKATKAGLKGLTPPIDGEIFSVKRGYQFRPSTLRKLNELKTKHPDLDVYLNTILDAAILHYYNYIMQEGGRF